MAEIIKTMKLYMHTDAAADKLFMEESVQYMLACNHVSQYIFDNGFPLNYMELHNKLYTDIRYNFNLKAQMAQSCIKTVVARYKTVKEQLFQSPYTYKDENGKTCYITRTLERLRQPINFKRPQIDLVRNRDYSFTKDGLLSVNTLGKRTKVTFEKPECFEKYFDGS